MYPCPGQSDLCHGDGVYDQCKVASIYLIAVIFLGCFLVFIMKKATKYFREVFEKYDDLNASVQENISAVRVVKAYVREEYETTKFQKAMQ